MDDKEIISRCADKMGMVPTTCADMSGYTLPNGRTFMPFSHWNPLTSDAQAMALLMFLLNSGHRVVIETNAMNCATYGKSPILTVADGPIYDVSTAEKMCRAICLGVAQLPDATHATTD